MSDGSFWTRIATCPSSQPSYGFLFADFHLLMMAFWISRHTRNVASTPTFVVPLFVSTVTPNNSWPIIMIRSGDCSSLRSIMVNADVAYPVQAI